MSQSDSNSLPRPDLADAPAASCWNEIGVMGDHSCPELVTAIHCRNCPVFTAAARAFLDRPAPPGYLAEWTRLLQGPALDPGDESSGPRRGLGAIVFRLGAEWLALRATVVVEVTPIRPVHRIPHRSNGTLAGLVNLRGQLHLCVCLHALLGTEPPEPAAARSRERSARMIVIRRASESWVFASDEVLGVPRVPPESLQNVPATLANPAVSFSQAVFTWQGRSVGLLDDLRLFDALRSLIP
jgi:chemotaxis-related protein WspD